MKSTRDHEKICKPELSFSIEKILNGNFKKAGTTRCDGSHRTTVHTPEMQRHRENPMQGNGATNLLERYEWLGFTRYNPPKLPKSSKRRAKQKRKPGRNPRVPFTTKQLATLEAQFQKMKYLSNEDVAVLCEALGLRESRIKIWFQNRRAREKKKTSQDEYIDVTGLDEMDRLKIQDGEH